MVKASSLGKSNTKRELFHRIRSCYELMMYVVLIRVAYHGKLYVVKSALYLLQEIDMLWQKSMP
jgi:hypothetical protein